MSKENSFKYLNTVLNNLKKATPLLIKFYKTHNPSDRSAAMMAGGGYNVLLFAQIDDKKLLPNIDINHYAEKCHYLDTLCYEENDPTGKISAQKTLKNIDPILEGWSDLFDETLKLLLKLLEPYQELKNLEGDNLKEYCSHLLNYGKTFRQEKLDNFIEIVNQHIKKDSKKAA